MIGSHYTNRTYKGKTEERALRRSRGLRFGANSDDGYLAYFGSRLLGGLFEASWDGLPFNRNYAAILIVRKIGEGTCIYVEG